jgi:uncharacterized protein (DUF1501 family)
MAITRRQFIRRAGIFTAGTFLGPSFFRNPLLRQALASTIGNRYFVSLYLDGGNDGLNTVTPYSDGTINLGGKEKLRQFYEMARQPPPMNGTGGIQLLTSDLNATLLSQHDPGSGAQLALHPGFGGGVQGGLYQLHVDGNVAVVQGVGYPEPNLSHDESRTKWQTADPLGFAGFGTGWIGRHIAAPTYGPLDIPAYCVRSEVPGEFAESSTSVLAVSQIANFGFPYDNFDSSTTERSARDTAFNALYAEAAGSPQSLLAYTGSVGSSTYNATKAYPQLSAAYDPGGARQSYGATYDQGGPNNNGTSTSRAFREVAKVIWGTENGAVDTRFFELSNGGYDTHSDQGGGAVGGQHYNLHKEVSDAIATFADDLRNMPGNVWNRTLILVWSEFSRRIDQNDNGTDHGSQAPVFVIGGGVTGGVYGKHPDIDQNDANALEDGNTIYRQGPASTAFRSTDMRDVYGTILQHWINVPLVQVQAILPVDLTGDPLYYWRTANFDLPFLP